ncbi:hypothetical protein HK102_009297 [Quaeritorhiza haematococci]|nr:hypothetical protein HK102_009297 [Quaeritorhiza haematococci]
MPYIYRTPQEMDYPAILGEMSHLPSDIWLHWSDPANRRDYVREAVTASLQGTHYFLPAIRGGSRAEGVRVAEAEYTITEGMSEAALEEELGALRREYWDRIEHGQSYTLLFIGQSYL